MVNMKIVLTTIKLYFPKEQYGYYNEHYEGNELDLQLLNNLFFQSCEQTNYINLNLNFPTGLPKFRTLLQFLH